MEFVLTEEQSLLRESVRRFVDKDYGFAARRKLVREGGAFSRGYWAMFAKMGWLGVAMPEDVGGYGGGAVDAAIVLEELGRGLVLEPYLGVAMLTAQTLERGAGQSQRAALLPPLVRGERVILLAHGEPNAHGRVSWVETRATRAGNRWTLRGRKSLVLGGPVAGQFVVSARTAGDAGEESGITLFLIPSDAAGSNRRDYRLIDDRLACDLVLDGVAVDAASTIGERRQRLRGARSRVQPCHRRRVRRSGRGDGAGALDHARLPHRAQAVRCADRKLPGAAASLGRHVHRA